MKRVFGNKSGIEVVFDAIVLLFLFAFCFIALYPFWYTFISSISDSQAVVENRVVLTPVAPINFDSYRLIFQYSPLWIGYLNSIYYGVLGTLINLIVTILAAYPMSRREFSGRKFMNIFVSITMFFSATGVMIPLYLVVRGLGLLNTRLSILIVFAAYPFFIIILRSFFETIPNEMIEAARIDGASEFHILLKVVLPISGAALATVALYYFINRWNGYFWAMVFLNDKDKYPLQVVLRQLIVVAETAAEMDSANAKTSPEIIKDVAIVVSTLPVVLVYPFIQKYFVKGVTLGAVKG